MTARERGSGLSSGCVELFHLAESLSLSLEKAPHLPNERGEMLGALEIGSLDGSVTNREHSDDAGGARTEEEARPPYIKF